MNQLLDKDYAEYLIWKANREEEKRKQGKYWLTPEGRTEIRECWGHNSTDCVPILLNELERIETQLRAILI